MKWLFNKKTKDTDGKEVILPADPKDFLKEIQTSDDYADLRAQIAADAVAAAQAEQTQITDAERAAIKAEALEAVKLELAQKTQTKVVDVVQMAIDSITKKK